MFFQPYTDYVIPRQIYNERDFGQKFVKAWVFDAATDDTILDGVEMTESSDELGRFRYTYRLPGDPTGNGRQLRIKTVVYTDSGYTERDLNYEIEEIDIVVRDFNVLGGGGGSGIDYDYLIDLIKKLIKKEIKEVDLQPLEGKVDSLNSSVIDTINNLPIPEIPKVIIKKVEIEKEVEKKEEIDLSPITEKINQIMELITEKEDLKKELVEIKEKQSSNENEKIEKIVETIVGNIKKIDTKLAEFRQELTTDKELTKKQRDKEAEDAKWAYQAIDNIENILVNEK